MKMDVMGLDYSEIMTRVRNNILKNVQHVKIIKMMN